MTVSIESSALTTIIVGVVTTVVSVGATWWFAKRRYSPPREPPTAEMARLDYRLKEGVAAGLIMLAAAGLLFGFLYAMLRLVD